MVKNFFCLSAIFLVLTAFSLDTTQNELAQYQKAKLYYKEKQFQEARDTLAPLLTAAKKSSTLIPYALFYDALCAYQQSKKEEAASIFMDLYYMYPCWEQHDEVLYWLALLQFEANDYITALRFLAKMQNKQATNSIDCLKTHYLSQINDREVLMRLLMHYPNDILVAKAMIKQELSLPFIEQDLTLLEQLSHRFPITHTKHALNFVDSLKSKKKEQYHIAVLLPFFIDEISYEDKNTNYFVMDLYKGICAGVAELEKKIGNKIQIHAYDTKKSSTVVEQLLEQPEMQCMDLFIGPLYANTMQLVTNFCSTYGINMFNPFSVNTHAVDHNPFVYLIKPSIETQAKQAAAFTMAKINEQPHQKQHHIAIVYGTAPEDAAKAYAYKRYMERHTKEEVDLLLLFKHEIAQKFLIKCRNKKACQDEKSDISTVLDDITHLYVASNDELIVANVLSLLQIRNLKPIIIGDATWLKKATLTLDQLQKLPLYLIAPDYIDYKNPAVLGFRQDFYEQFGDYPNVFAALGYDMILFLGTMLAEHGCLFQKGWEDYYYAGKIFPGFSYGMYHDNQIVPIISFGKTDFKVCNLPVNR